jgi:dTDP-4-dehydrorhamnose 3,5-epimerase
MASRFASSKSTLTNAAIGEHTQQAIRIPGDCWHGFTVVGTEQDVLLNVPTNRYDDDPDEERLPPDTEKIPMDWDEHPH